MYKIYNNEIKITNFLKGGADYAESLKSSYIVPKIIAGDTTFQLDNDTDAMVAQDLHHFDVFQGVPIDMNTANTNATTEIGNALERIHNALFNSTINVFNKTDPSSSADFNDSKQKTLHKNVLRYAVSWAKTIGLFDEANNRLLSEADYKNKFKTPPTTPNNPITPAENRWNMFFTSPGSGKNDKLKEIINGVNVLIKEYKESVDCKAIYAQINRDNMRLTHWRLTGGAHDSLNYILNGGMVASLIRIPDMVNYFRSQLHLVELRLKNVNKTLSEQSKQQIKGVIDKLETHEKNLKDTFELLKNAHTVDADQIDLKTHETELNNAKKSLKKHAAYTGALSSIIQAAVKAAMTVPAQPKLYP